MSSELIALYGYTDDGFGWIQAPEKKYQLQCERIQRSLIHNLKEGEKIFLIDNLILGEASMPATSESKRNQNQRITFTKLNRYSPCVPSHTDIALIDHVLSDGKCIVQKMEYTEALTEAKSLAAVLPKKLAAELTFAFFSGQHLETWVYVLFGSAVKDGRKVLDPNRNLVSAYARLWSLKPGLAAGFDSALSPQALESEAKILLGEGSTDDAAEVLIRRIAETNLPAAICSPPVLLRAIKKAANDEDVLNRLIKIFPSETLFASFSAFSGRVQSLILKARRPSRLSLTDIKSLLRNEVALSTWIDLLDVNHLKEIPIDAFSEADLITLLEKDERNAERIPVKSLLRSQIAFGRYWAMQKNTPNLACLLNAIQTLPDCPIATVVKVLESVYDKSEFVLAVAVLKTRSKADLAELRDHFRHDLVWQGLIESEMMHRAPLVNLLFR